MNKIKKLFLTVLGAVLFVCMGVAVAACGSSKKTYSVQTEYESSQGTVSLSPEAEEGKYEEGTEVTVTVTPKSGYTVGTFTVNGEGKELSGENTYQFTVEGDTTIAATFTSEQPTPKQFTLTKNVPENGTVEVTPAPGEGGKYAEGTELTVTLTPAQGYEVGTFTVNGTDKKGELQDNVYTFHITGETTIAVEFTAIEDFLDGKTIYSFDGYAFSFENKKANLLAVDTQDLGEYVMTADGAKIANADITFTKNDNGTVTMTQIDDGDKYVYVCYYVGQEYTVTVKETTITFTIEEVEPDTDGYSVYFVDSACKYNGVDAYCEGYGSEIFTAEVVGPSTYSVTVDLVEETITKTLSFVTLETETDGYTYQLLIDYNSDNSGRTAELTKVIEGGKESIGKATRQDVSGAYSWVFIVEDGSTTTSYTVTITGAVWGETAAQGDYTNAKITVTTESASALEDFLTGKTLFSLAAQKGYTFADGKATALATGSVAEDYVITSETTATIGGDVTLTKNEDGSVTIDEKTYFFVGTEVTLTVKEAGTDVNVVFTIQKVDVQNTSGIGDEYEVTFGGTTKYGDNVCTEVTVFGGELTLTYVDSSSKYAVTVDLSKNTATKALSGVSLLTDDQEYRLDINTGNANRYAELYKKDGSSYKLVAEDMMRHGRDDGTYYWEGTQTVGDTLTTYTIDIAGAIWGDPASLDKYSDAKITVSTKEQTSKTLTAMGSDKANYEITFLVEGGDISITRIKKGGEDLYYPRYMTHQNGEVFEKLGDKSFKYSYTKSEWDRATYTYKDAFYVLTITIEGDEVANWTMTVTADKLDSKLIYWTYKVDDSVTYDTITILYGSDGKPTGIASIVKLITGEGSMTLTGTSSVEDKGNGSYVITFTTETDGVIKVLVKGTGPNFTVELYQDDTGMSIVATKI